MGILGWIVLGLLAGAIAKAILPGDDPGGIIVTMIIGIVGALLGGFLAQVFFDTATLDEFFDISTWLTAIVGSIILLLLYRLVAGRGRRRPAWTAGGSAGCRPGPGPSAGTRAAGRTRTAAATRRLWGWRAGTAPDRRARASARPRGRCWSSRGARCARP